MNKLIAKSSGINWCWFTDYKILDENTVEILGHYRIHYGDNMPKTDKEFTIIENPNGRIAIELIIDTLELVGNVYKYAPNSNKHYTINNPQNIFSYPDNSLEYIMEETDS